MGAGREVAVRREVNDEGLDFGCPHFLGVPFVLEQDEPGYPSGVSLHDADAIVE